MQSNNMVRHMKVHNDSNPCPKCGTMIRTDKMLRHTTLCKDNISEDLCTRQNYARKFQPSQSSVQVYNI